eukprot:403354996
MGQIISQSDVTTFYNTYKIAVIGIVAPVILGVWLHYSVFKKPSEGQLVISYDDDDDLDENTIVSLIDKQFSIGKFPKLREKFNNLRRQLLRGYNKNTQMPYEKCVEYINLVLDYDNQLGQALEKNLEDLADIYSIRQEDIRRSQSKYINNSNSHKLLARNEVLQAEIPTFLTQEVALEIKHEMEEYAYRQQQWFMEFLINNQRGQDFSQVSENRRLQAEDIIDASNIGYDDEDQNDPEQVVYKSTTVAKYITLDMILDKEYKINEAQLKRMLYKSDFDRIDPNMSFFQRIKKWIFRRR